MVKGRKKGSAMTTAEATPQELAASVARTTDVQAIIDRLHAYCHTIDHGDSEGWLDCFTDDGSWAVQAVDGNLIFDLHGQGDLRGWIEETHSRNASGFQHMTLNPRVLSIDGDEAVATAYYLTSRIVDNILIMRGTGRYNDKLTRCADGQWRIKERRINRAFAYT
jgi:3-phenylpropionate/cinnamic acid dioxygenase small subunit